MVREAYSLLRQSIIHVEKDDIDIDDDEDEDEVVAPHANGLNGTNGHAHHDEDMNGDSIAVPQSSAPGVISSPTRGPAETPAQLGGRQPTPGTSGANGAGSTEAQRASTVPPAKKKLTISYDKYQMMKSLIVLKLSEIERETGEGVPRAEIVTWYLEQRENEIQTVEELETEKALCEKVISKLIKEKQLLELVGQGLQSEDTQEESQAAASILYVHPDYEN
jgi:DNA replication licensing factor MCM6